MPAKHIVNQGDCISSIAFNVGFFPDTIWDHTDNAALKKERKDPQCLLPGDVVVVPDLTQKSETCAAESRHRFRRKGVPETLRVRFTVRHEPRANEKYRIDIDGVISQGQTDDDGWINAAIPPNAQKTLVFLGQDTEPVEFQLGRLDPIEEVSGVKGRLRNLGYYFGQVDNKDDSELEGALLGFQEANDLKLTGDRDDSTLLKLSDLCGEESK